MIVATKEGFLKNNYRKFNIKEAKTNDDFEMIYEVLYRRFLRLRNIPSNSDEFPDLIIIDGGKGQLSMAKKALKKAKIDNLEIIGISKGRNRNDNNEIIHLLNGDYSPLTGELFPIILLDYTNLQGQNKELTIINPQLYGFNENSNEFGDYGCENCTSYAPDILLFIQSEGNHISNLTLTGSNAGSAISCEQSSPNFDHVIIRENYGSNGPGVQINWDSASIFTNVDILNNISSNYGGGVWIQGNSWNQQFSY